MVFSGKGGTGADKAPLVAQFGGFSIKRRKESVLVDQQPPQAYTKGTGQLETTLQFFCKSRHQLIKHCLTHRYLKWPPRILQKSRCAAKDFCW
jgi:hypothetical protein